VRAIGLRHILVLSALTLGGAGLARALGFSLVLPDLRSALVFLVLAPALEEYVFRAQLQQWLADRWKHPRYALWGATALFALGHAPWVGWQALWLMLPGLVLGWVWWRYRRLSLNVLIHAGFNAALVLTTLWI
jgi:membrane protease YdiL (CAAX protease family)